MNGLATLAPSGGPGWLDGRDARLRLLAALGYALVTVSLQRVPVLLAASCVALSLAAAGGLAWRTLVRRLLGLEVFLFLLLLTLPFTVPGEAWIRLGPLTGSWEGLVRAAVIVLKANAVVLALLGLTGSLEPVAMGHALAGLKVPDKLVHLFLFTVRYLCVLHEEYRRLRRAMSARAFVPRNDRHTWRIFGWLLGMLLVRSLERARRVASAMKCRGFHGRFYLLETAVWAPEDTRLAFLLSLGLAGLLALEHLG